MSLLDLLKDKPPAVSVGDVSWPPPVKDVSASSSTAAAAPFLSSSPLFAAKRTPTLREFLHPNYRDRREEQRIDSTREASDSRLVVERCKTSVKFSKSDLDSQRMRSKTPNSLYSKNARNQSEENSEKLEVKDTKKAVVSVDKKLNILDSASWESRKNKCLFSGLSVLSNLISSTKRDEMKEEIPQGVTNGNDILASNCENTTDPSITLGAAVNTGKHKNMMLDDNDDDGHAFLNVNKVSKTKRKASEVVSEEDKKDMIEEMKKQSQEYASSITLKEKVAGVHLSDKLPLRQEGSVDKDNTEVNNDNDISASSICDHENPTNTEMTLENKKTGIEKQDNMIINHNGYSVNTNQISKTKRKLSEVISEEDDTDMNEKVKKNSQDYFCGISSEEEVTNVPQELSMTQEDSDDKDTEWKMTTVTSQKNEFFSKDSDDKVQNLHSKTDKYRSQKHPEEPAHKESEKRESNFRDDNCNTTNNDQKKSTAKMHEEQFHLKANETHTTQNTDQEDSNDDLKEGKELVLKADICKASSNDQEKSINILLKDQKLLLKTDACSMQSNVCQQSSNNKPQEEQGLSLNADICSTEGSNQQEFIIKIHMEEGSTSKTDTGPHTGDEKNSGVCLESNEKMCLNDKKVIDSLPTTKENLTTVDSTAHQKDGPEDSLSNIKSRAKCSTENMTSHVEDITVKNPQKSAQLDIPKRAAITLSQKIIKACSSFHMQMLNTDTSDSSSTENEAYETAIKQDVKVLEKNCKTAIQNNSSEDSLSDVKTGVKTKNFTEVSSDFQKEFPINKCSSHQETTPLDILPSTEKMSTIVDRTAMDSDSEDTSSSDDGEDMQDDLKYEVDEKFLEVLVFPDSDDDDDGLEDGEIGSDSSDSSDESSESEESVDTCTADKDPSKESKGSMNSKPSAALLKRSRSSKKNRKKRKRKRLLKQGKKMGTNFPTKKAKIDESTNKKLKEPSDYQSKILEPSETQNKKPADEVHDGFSLLSTLKSSAVLDVTVAASEKELIKKKTRGGKVSAKKRKKLQKRMNEYMARKAEERRKWEARMAALPMPVCVYYSNGTCHKGDDCQFRHEGSCPKKPQLCKYYVCGVCEKGNDCLYQHEYPCKYFHFGSRSCSHGDKCRFSHDAPTTETQVLFDQLRADLAQENAKATDEVSVSQNSVGVSTTDSNLPSSTPAKDSEDLYHLKNRSVQKTPYTIRYSSIDQQEDFGEECSAAQEDVKVDKESSNNEKPEQQDTISFTSTPSYIVPGMYPS